MPPAFAVAWSLTALVRFLPMLAGIVLALLATPRAGAQVYRFFQIYDSQTEIRGHNAMAFAPDGTAYFNTSSRPYASTVLGDSIIRRRANETMASRFVGGIDGSADGTGVAAQFRLIGGMAVDSAGNLYVADSGNHTVRKVTPQGIVTTVAGRAEAPGSADGPGAAARFNSPEGIAVDASGALYVSDTNNAAIRRIGPDGAVTTIAGLAGATGTVDGAGSVARFARPRGLAIDRSGNLYVADFPATLRKITPSGTVSTLAGSPGLTGSADGVGQEVRFNGLTSLVATPEGLIYIADSGNATVRTCTADGRVATIGGQPEQTLGYNESKYLALQGELGGKFHFTYPHAVALDPSGVLYVSDRQLDNTRRAVLEAGAAPPILHTPPASLSQSVRHVGPGTEFKLSAAANGTPPLRYEWRKGDEPIPGATADTLTLPAVIFRDQDSYTVTVSNAAGTVRSNPVILRIFTPRSVDFTTRRSVPGGSFLWAVAEGAGQFVTVGTGGKILSSIDGTTWTPRDSGTAEWLVGLTYGDGRFVAVGDHGIVLLSTDGVTWSRARDSGTTQRLNNVLYAAGRFTAVGEAGTIITSTDAQIWTATKVGDGWLRGIAYAPAAMGPAPASYYGFENDAELMTGTFYAAGQGGVIYRQGSSGWSSAARPTSADIEALVGPQPSGVGQDGKAVYRSFEFRTVGSYPKIVVPTRPGTQFITTIATTRWQTFDIGIKARFRAQVAAAGATYLMGENGVIAAGGEGFLGWSAIPSGTTANLVGAVFSRDRLVVVGENETILISGPLLTSQFTNLSTRGTVAPDAGAMIAGFVVKGDAPKQTLLRASGPALRGFGLAGTLAGPVLTVFDSAGRQIAANARWSTAANAAAIATTATSVGAFPFAAGSADSALLLSLAPGAYSAQVSGQGATTGLALVEVYDADAQSNTGPRAINLSTRGRVGTNGEKLIAGVVINGVSARKVLIRAIGPALKKFGLTDVLEEPQIEIFDSRGGLFATAGAWNSQYYLASEIRQAADTSGAFALDEDSPDAATTLTLPPGAWTIQVSGLNGKTGLALVEVYEVP